MLYCIVMAIVAGFLCLCSFTNPTSKPNFQVSLGAYAALASFGFIAYVVGNQGMTIWSAIWFGDGAIVGFVSWLPYLGFRLGTYLGERYEGTRI
jgi:hypothetical protein